MGNLKCFALTGTEWTHPYVNIVSSSTLTYTGNIYIYIYTYICRIADDDIDNHDTHHKNKISKHTANIDTTNKKKENSCCGRHSASYFQGSSRRKATCPPLPAVPSRELGARAQAATPDARR